MGREQEWRGVEGAYHSPGSVSPLPNMWFKFVVGSYHVARVPLGVLRSTSLQKTHSKLKFHQDRGPALEAVKADAASSLNIITLWRGSIIV